MSLKKSKLGFFGGLLLVCRTEFVENKETSVKSNSIKHTILAMSLTVFHMQLDNGWIQASFSLKLASHGDNINCDSYVSDYRSAWFNDMPDSFDLSYETCTVGGHFSIWGLICEAIQDCLGILPDWTSVLWDGGFQECSISISESKRIWAHQTWSNTFPFLSHIPLMPYMPSQLWVSLRYFELDTHCNYSHRVASQQEKKAADVWNILSIKPIWLVFACQTLNGKRWLVHYTLWRICQDMHGDVILACVYVSTVLKSVTVYYLSQIITGKYTNSSYSVLLSVRCW